MDDNGMDNPPPNAMVSIQGLVGIASPGDKINFVLFARTRASVACSTPGEMLPLVERTSGQAPELDNHQYREQSSITG